MPIKTYLLAPNFTYRPNTSICLGDIIADPSDPTKPLSSAPASSLSPPLTQTHLDFSAHLQQTTSSSLQGSIFAKFLEVAEARLGGGVSHDVLDSYTIDRLETVYFTKQPTDEEAAERVKEEKVRAAVSAGWGGKRDVYIITGLKIARGLKVVTGRWKGWNVDAGVGAPVLASGGVEVGVEGGVARQKGVEVSYEVGDGQDVVFAYQLHVVKHRGLRGKRVEATLYAPQAAFLNDEKDETGGGEGLEVVVASEDEVRKYDQEMPVSIFTAKDGEDSCICLAFDEE
jgi:hypothetical protein